MGPGIVFSIICGYFIILLAIARITSRKTDKYTFYTANRQSPWFLVAFGMIGATLSGVTFISVPGEVGNSQFSYFQVVLGYVLGYLVIGTVLLPLYYRLNLISIYGYLGKRLGFYSYKTGAFYFLLSRVIGSAFRLYLVANVLQIAFFDAFGIPFWCTVLVTIALIWLYTNRGGIKTIVWTDALQTAFMLLAVIVSIIFMAQELNWSVGEITNNLQGASLSKIFHWDWQSPDFFPKQFLSGAFIAIVMTGLDQDMMQKNLTCRSLKDAQKNMFWFTIILIGVNFLFLCLGGMLYQYAEIKSITLPAQSDDLFPELAVHHFHIAAGITFLLGITAAAYSSADSALTALTTAFCVDILGNQGLNDQESENVEVKHQKYNPFDAKLRQKVHIGFSLILFVVILVFQWINDESVIVAVFTAAGYTYGPLLGMFALGLFTNIQPNDKYVPWVAVASPIICYILSRFSTVLFGGYEFGFEILIINGLLTFIGLSIFKKK